MISTKILLFLGFLPFSASALEVNTLADEVDNGGSFDDESMDGTGLSLREAVGLVNRGAGGTSPGEEILIRSYDFFPDGEFSAIQLAPALGEIVISEAMSIETQLGVSIKLDAQGNSRIFLITRPEGYTGEMTVELQSLEFINGDTEEDGGAIHVTRGANLSLDNCNFSTCEAIGNGGAIYCSGEGSILDSGFTTGFLIGFDACKAGGNGGAIAVEEGGESYIDLDIANCEAGENGGAFYQEGGSCGFGAIISDCRATNGGGLYFSDLEADLGGCQIMRNEAEGNGGAIVFQNVILSPGASSIRFISDNRAVNGAGIYATNLTTNGEQNTLDLYDNKASGDGGGIWASDSMIRVISSSLARNSAGGTGGGGGAYISNSDVRWVHGGIVANEATGEGGHGGGFHIIEPRENVLLVMSELQGNVADGSGGGIYFESEIGGLILAPQKCLENRAIKGDGGVLSSISSSAVELMSVESIIGNSAGGNGGALCLSGGGGFFTDATFSENSCLERGGAICVLGNDDSVPATSSISIYGSFTGNQALGSEGKGGAIFIQSQNVILGGSFGTNFAVDVGGAIAVENGLLEMDFSQITGNRAGSEGSVTQGKGGGVYLGRGSILNANGLRLSENVAGFQGGGIWIGEVAQAKWDSSFFLEGINRNHSNGLASMGGGGGGAYLEGGILVFQPESVAAIQENTTKGNGGGVLIREAGSVDALGFTELSSISGNVAEGDGGGVYTETGVCPHLFIEENTATRGGGVFSTAAETTYIDNCGIYFNVATEIGGGVFSETIETKVTFATIEGNRADSGGGLYAVGDSLEMGGVSSALGIDGFNVFRDNSADAGNGGGIFFQATGQEATASFNRTLVTECTASAAGGGIFLNGIGAPAFVSECSITGNSAGSDGGGIAAEGEASLVIERSGIVECAATSEGGALWGKVIHIIQSTISGNTAAVGGGIYIQDEGFLEVEDSTIGWNTASASGGGIAAGNAIVGLNYSTIAGNIAGRIGGGVFVEDGNLVGEGAILAENSAEFGADCLGPVGDLRESIVTDFSGIRGDTSALVSENPLLIPRRGSMAYLTVFEFPSLELDIPTDHFELHNQSPAIDAGRESSGNGNDQRWFVSEGQPPYLRTIGERVDLGAIEYQRIAPNYENWAETNISDSNHRKETDDADGDGMVNGLERLFGTDPDVASGEVLAFVESTEGLILNYPLGFVRPGSDLFEWSTDLEVWERGLPEGAVRELSISPGTEVNIRLPQDGTKRFYRVVAE